MNINDVKEGQELYYTAPSDVAGEHVLPSGWYTVHHIDTACNPPQVFIGSEYMGTAFEGYTFSNRLSDDPENDVTPFEPEVREGETVMNINDVKVGDKVYYSKPSYIPNEGSMPSGWYTVDRIELPRVYIEAVIDGHPYSGFTFDYNLSSDYEDKFETEDDRLKVNPHYAQGTTLDPWEIMRQKFTPEEFKGYLKGNILKYLMRFDHKGTPLQDLRKIEDHVKELIRHYEEAE